MDLPWDRIAVTVTDEQLGHRDANMSSGGQVVNLLYGGGISPEEEGWCYAKEGKSLYVPIVDYDDLQAEDFDIDEIEENAQRNLERFPWPADVVVLGMGESGDIASHYRSETFDRGMDTKCARDDSKVEPFKRIILTPNRP